MNDETVEFMAPYLELEAFTAAVAKNASKAAEGLCSWVRAMAMYHDASKMVKPKLEALRLAEGRLEAAQSQMSVAEGKLSACQDILNKLQEDFESRMMEKTKIEANAMETRKKMETATKLIDGLGAERTRWGEDSKKFADRKLKLVGDCVVASEFLNYCGPFNKSYRDLLLHEHFMTDLQGRNVPMNKALEMSSFLIDMGTVSDWNIQGLPTDTLSIQNGILVTQSSRYPLLIDPQGQALTWIMQKEVSNLPSFGITTLTHPKFKDQLEFCICEGKALVVHEVEETLDSVLDPVLEKQLIVRAKSQYLSISEKLVEYNPSFMLYMSTRLSNPHFSPELQAKTTVVDFTVTQRGLEEQLLGRVIQKEQKSLEEQLIRVQLEVNANTKALLHLDALLLERLTANEGNLLDDLELIGVLANTKAKSTEVNEKLISAEHLQIGIHEKRELYRPVATRGSVLYFCIVDTSLMNSMYQTSLDQFLTLFSKSIDKAKSAPIPSKRVNSIIETMTYVTYRYINRGLYEKDKLTFVVLLGFKILQVAQQLSSAELLLFLKAGAGIDASTCPANPFAWLPNVAWTNIVQLNTEIPFFVDLIGEMKRTEIFWKTWYEEEELEKHLIPVYEEMLLEPRNGTSGHFLRLLLLRCMREDRVVVATHQFLRNIENVTTSVEGKLPLVLSALGEKYIQPVSDTIESVVDESDPTSPVIYLLSAGADPTESIENQGRKRRVLVNCVSMGEGQEPIATKAMNSAILNGSWVLLQNGHLGLPFMDTVNERMNALGTNVSPNFRLFITSEPHAMFPIALLQRSIKVTNEPPAGLRSGLLRSYTVLVDQDRIDRIESPQWRKLLYTLCFMHSIVQERCKFGSLGWNIPYEFSTSDLSACISFLEKHLYAGPICWPTLQYMVGEVQYGGRITDDFDRILFNTYTDTWLNNTTLQSSFQFNPETRPEGTPLAFTYAIPEVSEVEDFHKVIAGFPDRDSPELFGLHNNAEQAYNVKQAHNLIASLASTQPKEASLNDDAVEDTREQVVLRKCTDLLARLPSSFVPDTYLNVIEKKLGGFSIPLNIFFYQEIQRFQTVLDTVQCTLTELQQAIHGEIIMTSSLQDALNALFDADVPRYWMFSLSGDELSWLSPTLGMWFGGLLERHTQLTHWLLVGRPISFWLTGFFNPQGFLTAMRQEVARLHQTEAWSLDDVVLLTEVTDFITSAPIKQAPRDGVFIHGLSLEGAGWSVDSLVESTPKVLFSSLPVLHVTAVTKVQKRNKSSDYGPYGGYSCPCYKYRNRSSRHFIFPVMMYSREYRPSHWILRGVALLCSTE